MRRTGCRRSSGDQLQFIYLCDPTRVVDENARTLAEATPAIAAEQFRGGTQAIAFDGGWLALVHEVSERDKLRYYQHRFVWFDSAERLRRVSRPFYFIKNGSRIRRRAGRGSRRGKVC